jgi:hypothetical protein
MADHWDSDDDLLAELGDAVRTAQEVPARFVDVGKSAFLWRDIDAELAVLGYDSVDAAETAGTRAQVPSVRVLRFSGSELSIELEIGPDTLHGQIVPPQPGELDFAVRPRAGTGATVPVDEVGWFVIRPKPAGMIRLRLRPATGSALITDWTAL